MSKQSLQGNGTVMATADLLERELPAHAISCTLVDSMYRRIGGVEVCTLVFEKYYMRAKNRVSLTAVICGSDNTVFVDLIGAGGGQGPLLSLSWGSEGSFVDEAIRCLQRNGF